MRKPIRRKIQNSGAVIPKLDKPLIDVWLQRTVWTVQILLFPLAIFGYIFTVRPVYQKQLLDEKIAERTVIYSKAMHDVEELTAQQTRLTAENRRLSADTKKLYSSLRENVLTALPSLAQSCGFDPKLTGNQLYTCVQKAINEQVMPALNQPDVIKLGRSMLFHRSEITALPDLVDKQRREAALKNQAESDSVDQKLGNMPRAFIAKIQKMRGTPQSKVRTVKELGELRTDEEANAYLDFQAKYQDLIFKRNSLTMDKIGMISSGISPVISELRKIMEKVAEEVRK